MAPDSQDTFVSAVKGEPGTRHEANKILEEIQDRKGYLSESTIEWLDRAPSERRKEIIRKFDALRREAVKFIRSTTALNSSDAHFIHEILQNADDAKYNRAGTDHFGKVAWIKFQVRPGKIIVESNEDGFTRADVEAICETGESSKRWNKTGQPIGEKGIGFKSIFRIAEKVHIASGFWNFRFDHPDDDDGLGMVTPIPNPPVELPPEVGTRITLDLNQRYRDNYAKIVKEFDQVDDTTICFLRNVSQVQVMTLTDASWTGFKICKRDSTSESTRTITRTLLSSSDSNQLTEVSKNSRHYQIFSSKKIMMPQDARRHSNRATVVLAFPTDTDGNRAVLDPAGQQVFAFLPMYRKVQLHFLIHSDFITAANRESTEDCDWNDQLLESTADTFCKAVAYFCAQGILLYEWPKYVPTLAMDGFWETLSSLIIAKLQQKTVLCTWTSRTLKLPHQLRRVSTLFKFQGEPLLADRTDDQELYLAQEFEQYADLLKQLGVPSLKHAEAFDRLKDDLSRSASKIKNHETAPKWHESMAIWALSFYEDPALPKWQAKLKTLDIIPTTSGKWRAVTTNSPLYFPTLKGVKVPVDIGLDLVDMKAASSPKRNELFSRLGVEHCDAAMVRKKILRHHKTVSSPAYTIDLVEQLYFLYRFRGYVLSKGRVIWISTDGIRTKRCTEEIYLSSDKPFSADWITVKSKEMTRDGMMKREEWILHPDYFQDKLIDRSDRTVTWTEWLMQEIGVCEFPVLTNTGDETKSKLSGFLTNTLSVSSQLFLDTLKARWYHEYRSIYFGQSFPQDILNKCAVSCVNGKLHYLKDTYLPVITVIDCARELGIQDHSKILELDKVLLSSTNQWSFLQEVGVHTAVDLEFYIEALRAMSTSRSEGFRPMLAYTYMGANVQKKQSQQMKDIFAKESLIHDLRAVFLKDSWYQSAKCVWDGPDFLTVKKPIAHLYKDDANAMHLFRNILELPDASWEDMVDQLRKLSVPPKQFQRSASTDETSAVYLELFAMNNVPWDEVKLIFSREKLILASGKWYTLNHCLWSSVIDIQGHPTLQRQYPHLESFFVHGLGIKKASATQVVSELIRKTKSEDVLTVPEAKTFIKQISAILEVEGAKDEIVTAKLSELRWCKIFPVKDVDGQVQLHKSFDEFAVRDHYEYSVAFENKCPFLDFSFEEFAEVLPLLEALSMEYNFISELVEERPSVGNDARFDEVLTAELCQKAHCLLSCAYKYRSSRALDGDSSLLEDLEAIQVYTCSTIATELVLEIDDAEIVSFGKHAQVLLENRDDRSCLFLPSSEQQRRSTFRLRLPQELLRFMDIKQEGARHPIAQLLLCPLSDMEDVMKTENIPIVPWLERHDYDFGLSNLDPTTLSTSSTNGSTTMRGQSASMIAPELYPTDHESENSESDQSGLPSPVFTSSLSKSARPPPSFKAASFSSFGHASKSGRTKTRNVISPQSSTLTGPGFGQPSESSTFVFGQGTTIHTNSTFSASFGTSRLAESFTPSSVSSQAAPYRSLLSQLIRIARNNASQPNIQSNSSSGIFDLSSVATSLPSLTSVESVFGPPDRDQKFKIGAAGELYVFEHLNKLGLPDFGRENWQSRVRKHVKVHPSYSDLSDWEEAETADIVYQDTTSRLQQWLRRVSCNGYPDLASSRTLPRDFECKYYIEVKATTAVRCDEKFFLSKGEYNLMQSMETKRDATPEAIYVVFRVFNLMSENIGFKVFVDPWRLRDAPGQPSLKFEASQWEVYPTTGMCPVIR